MSELADFSERVLVPDVCSEMRAFRAGVQQRIKAAWGHVAVAVNSATGEFNLKTVTSQVISHTFKAA